MSKTKKSPNEIIENAQEMWVHEGRVPLEYLEQVLGDQSKTFSPKDIPTIYLTEKDAEVMIEALENPPKPTKRLIEAAKKLLKEIG